MTSPMRILLRFRFHYSCLIFQYVYPHAFAILKHPSNNFASRFNFVNCVPFRLFFVVFPDWLLFLLFLLLVRCCQYYFSYFSFLYSTLTSVVSSSSFCHTIVLLISTTTLFFFFSMFRSFVVSFYFSIYFRRIFCRFRSFC